MSNEKTTSAPRPATVWRPWRILRLLAIAYIGYDVILFFMQRSLIYPGTRLVPPTEPSAIARLCQPVRLELPSGPLTAAYAPPPADGGKHPAVIFCHGNNELAADLPFSFEALQRMGMGVMLVEYPGFAGQPGSPSEQSTVAAAVAAYDALASRPEIDRTRIVGFGRSLGGGVVCGLSRQRALRALILQSTFTSLKPFAAGFFVPSFLVRDVYDNLAVLASYAGPVLLLHGRQDSVVPFEHGRQLAATGKNVRFAEFEGGHEDIMDLPQLWDSIGQFLHDERIIVATDGAPEL